MKKIAGYCIIIIILGAMVFALILSYGFWLTVISIAIAGIILFLMFLAVKWIQE